MATVILIALMVAFTLAFSVRIVKWLTEVIYGLAPYVMLVVGFVALLILLDKHETQEEINEIKQEQVKMDH